MSERHATFIITRFRVHGLITREQLLSFWKMLDSKDESDHTLVYTFISANWDKFQIAQTKSNAEVKKKYQQLLKDNHG